MRLLVGILVVVSATHLLAQLIDHGPLCDITQILLMPALAAVLWKATTAPRGRLLTLVLWALAFSWLGDTAPRFVPDGASFLAMVGAFLIAQLLYAVAFWPYRSRSLLVRPLLVLPYAVAGVLIVVLCAAQAGPLLPAIAVYAAAIMAMAVLATGLGRLAGLGGAVFVLSDSLIALDAFDVLTLPAHGFWVMSTYMLAQLLLVAAVRARAESAPSAL